MIPVQSGLYVRIEQRTGPRVAHPLPLASGFSADFAYLTLGMFKPSETSQPFVILSNDADEIWFVPNCHVRACALLPERHEVRLPLATLADYDELDAHRIELKARELDLAAVAS